MEFCKTGDGNTVLAAGDWFCPNCLVILNKIAPTPARPNAKKVKAYRIPAALAPYVLRYRSVDGYTEKGSFKTAKGARAFIEKWIGLDCEIGTSYAVGRYGDRTITPLVLPLGETLTTILEG